MPVTAPTKMEHPSGMINVMGSQPTPMSFDGWEGGEYPGLPTLDQFPDYDWAASFDFSNEVPQIPQVPIGPINGGPAGYQFG